MEGTSKIKLLSIFVTIFLISIVSFSQNIVADNSPHAVKGVLYINDEIASEGIEIILSFPDEDITTITYEYNLYGDFTNYNLGFWNHEGDTGYFFIDYQGTLYEPDCNKSILVEGGVTFYIIDLYITVPVNSPPYKPINPEPEDNSTDVNLNPILKVDVTDPDDDSMDVFFYDESDDGLIAINYNVKSGGTATVQWKGLSYNTEYFWYAIANDSVCETKSDVWNFTTLSNQPPDKPTCPTPADGEEDVIIDPFLSVHVTDPDGDTMDVSFFDASNDNLIGTDSDVASGSSASVKWENLSYNTTYSWYAVAADKAHETRSDNWSFTTKEEDNTPPEVEILSPQKGLYIFGRKILPRFIRPALIIGKITIEANATDDDSGIEKVVFYINGKEVGNDTTEPYEYLWKWNRPRLIHIFVIKVEAYDFAGESASDRMIVRKFL
jgi:hypothetical protein